VFHVNNIDNFLTKAISSCLVDTLSAWLCPYDVQSIKVDNRRDFDVHVPSACQPEDILVRCNYLLAVGVK
jgi:hypothetical protein